MTEQNTEQTTARPPRFPRLGAGRAIAEMQREAERNVDDLKPTPAERELGTYEAIVKHRESERAALLAQGAPVLEEAPAPAATSRNKLDMAIESAATGIPLVDVLRKYEQPTLEAKARAEAERVAAFQEKFGALLKEAHALPTRLGALRSKYLARVQDVAGLDLKAILASVPKTTTWARGPGRDGPCQSEGQSRSWFHWRNVRLEPQHASRLSRGGSRAGRRSPFHVR